MIDRSNFRNRIASDCNGYAHLVALTDVGEMHTGLSL